SLGARSQVRYSPTAPADTTNLLSIQLREGFSADQRAVISIDGREVYAGRPMTVKGLAEVFTVTNASPHPVIIFNVWSRNVAWSNTLDLTSGSVLEISLTANGAVRALQSTNFAFFIHLQEGFYSG